MGHPLGDGTPVYRYRQRPGLPAVSVMRFNTETAHADLPPGHRHAHDFLVLVYIEEGAGLVTVDGTERPAARRPGPRRGTRAGHRHHDRGRTLPQPRLGGRVHGGRRPRPGLGVPADLDPSPPSSRCSLPAPGTPASPSPTGRPGRRGWPTSTGELADPGRLGAREAAAAALTRLLVAAARLAPAAPGSPDPLVERVFTEIEARFREAVSAADIARALGYTPGYLTTVLRRRTGRPLLDWITERRMIEVRRLLRRTDLPLDAVAARTGLGDATYLVRRFRNRYGVTPQRWRHAERRGP
ncbi:AraC family transcriptional regulator [Actinomadura madurae]|uniref:helix-turn-helix transcriptional regulator n=1 Tax=Actinomadura madurae TaxID=1993 RepID=UPI002027553D|nr:AraC family transcriptional regulator [Actinomadura madurae]URM93797.1 AraC family transcriptional regulator [Actinomadura madurae]